MSNRSARRSLILKAGLPPDPARRLRRSKERGAPRRLGREASLLDDLDFAFYELDEQFRFVQINHQAENYWARPRAELLGQHIWSAFPQAVGSKAYEAHLTAYEDRRSVDLQVKSPVLGVMIELHIQPILGGLAVRFSDRTELSRRQG